MIPFLLSNNDTFKADSNLIQNSCLVEGRSVLSFTKIENQNLFITNYLNFCKGQYLQVLIIKISYEKKKNNWCQ